ncbi:unnamed protein product [Lathyrus oleraceus]
MYTQSQGAPLHKGAHFCTDVYPITRCGNGKQGKNLGSTKINGICSTEPSQFIGKKNLDGCKCFEHVACN